MPVGRNADPQTYRTGPKPGQIAPSHAARTPDISISVYCHYYTTLLATLELRWGSNPPTITSTPPWACLSFTVADEIDRHLCWRGQPSDNRRKTSSTKEQCRQDARREVGWLHASPRQQRLPQGMKSALRRNPHAASQISPGRCGGCAARLSSRQRSAESC